jgi:mono/diheme cytochrome c family protein
LLALRAAALALGLAASFSCLAGDAQRRFSAELAIIAGDFRMLHVPGVAPHHRRGLHARILSALGGLRLLAREYVDEQVSPGERRRRRNQRRSSTLDLAARREGALQLTRRVDELRVLYEQGRYGELEPELTQLTRQYPLPLERIDPTGATDADIERARGLYQTLCMSCHSHADPSPENPAYDLFQQARTSPRVEFVARMLNGVRGTPEIGLRNPLTDTEIAALVALFTAQGQSSQ